MTMAERKPKIELTWKQCEMVASYYRFPTAVLLFNEDTMKKRLKGHRKDKVPMAELRKQLAEKEKENAALTARVKELQERIEVYEQPLWTVKEKPKGTGCVESAVRELTKERDFWKAENGLNKDAYLTEVGHYEEMRKERDSLLKTVKGNLQDLADVVDERDELHASNSRQFEELNAAYNKIAKAKEAYLSVFDVRTLEMMDRITATLPSAKLLKIWKALGD